MIFWVFGLSLAAVCLMLGLKMLELWLNRVFVISKILTKADPFVARYITISVRTVTRYKKVAWHWWSEHLPRHSKKISSNIKSGVNEKYYVLSTKVKKKLGYSESKKGKDGSGTEKDVLNLKEKGLK